MILFMFIFRLFRIESLIHRNTGNSIPTLTGNRISALGFVEYGDHILYRLYSKSLKKTPSIIKKKTYIKFSLFILVFVKKSIINHNIFIHREYTTTQLI